MMGNLFEWYDFALFGYFAPIIGKLFFPSFDSMTQLLSAYGAFAAGYLARPLGGLLFGYIGDRYGRKKALVLTILLMAIPTAIIGILPTYNDIGIAASVLLIVLRLLQGISMGGNYSGSITFTTEHSPEKNRGLIGSFAVTSCLTGLLLGSGTAALFSLIFEPIQLETWVGYYMRRTVPESPAYEAAQEAGELINNPVKTLFKDYGMGQLGYPIVMVVKRLWELQLKLFWQLVWVDILKFSYFSHNEYKRTYIRRNSASCGNVPY
eukprot:gene14726-14852_t